MAAPAYVCELCGSKNPKHKCKAVATVPTGTLKAKGAFAKSQAAWDDKAPTFSAKFKTHVMEGEKSGKTHTGLHAMNTLLAKNDKDIVAVLWGQTSHCYVGSATLYEVAKISSFFPNTSTYDQIKGYVTEAWRSHKKYPGSVPEKMCGASWAGQCTIGQAAVWVGWLGSDDDHIDTAFPIIVEAAELLKQAVTGKDKKA